MDEIYIIFDQIPLKRSGGLIATYIDFVKELSQDFKIIFVSVFRSNQTDIEEFRDIKVITLFDLPIDNRFYRAIEYLNEGDFKACSFALMSAVRFFSLIPLGRLRTKRLFVGKKVIAVAPAAAMFLNKDCRYILEVHTQFEYFWGSNLLGRAQSMLLHEPALTVFRSVADARKANRIFPSSHLYNTFDSSNLSVPLPADSVRHNALFMGRLSEQKNPIMLLECTKEILKVIPDFQLDLFGDGELRETLESAITDLSLSDHIHLKGFIQDKSIYRNYDVLLITSKVEGLSLAIIEAAANMVPTISTEWGDAVYEEIDNGKSGYIVASQQEFVNRTIEIVTSLELRNCLAQGAFSLYNDRFSTFAHRKAWLDIIERVYRGKTES